MLSNPISIAITNNKGRITQLNENDLIIKDDNFLENLNELIMYVGKVRLVGNASVDKDLTCIFSNLSLKLSDIDYLLIVEKSTRIYGGRVILTPMLIVNGYSYKLSKGNYSVGISEGLTSWYFPVAKLSGEEIKELSVSYKVLNGSLSLDGNIYLFTVKLPTIHVKAIFEFQSSECEAKTLIPRDISTIMRKSGVK